MLSSRIEVSGVSKTVFLEGRIDMSNAEKFEEIVLKGTDKLNEIQLDLSGLTFIDSTGVGNLVSVIKKCKKNDILFGLSNVPEGVEQILDIIGVYDILKFLYSSEV